MTGVQEISCRLCLKTVIVKSFEVIGNVIRDILDVLLLKLKLDDESKEVICNVCRRKLYAAFEFKSTCLNTDNTIIPHVDCEKMLQLDIREVYRKEERSNSISDSQKICRLCMNSVKSEFMCIREEELEAIQKLTPEMNINIIKDPVICQECFDSLCTHNSFLRECLEVEEKFRGVYDNSATESRIDTSPSDIFVKTENLGKEYDISEMEMSMKTECVDIKSEDEEGSDTPLQNLDNDPSEKSDCKDAEEGGRKNENRSENKCIAKIKRECKVLYKCDKSICQTGCKSHFTAHCAGHENNSEEYKCESCEYETENKKLLQSQLRHKDPSQVKMYRCNDCDYKSKYKGDIRKHELKHKNPSEVQMYRCNDCDYETKYKFGIKQHQLKHKDPFEVQTYGCNYCDYKTNYRANFKTHQLKHKDPSEVQMYKCSDCNYESKYKNGIKKHQLKHKDPSQVHMYRCNDCDYENKYKYAIKHHQLKHKDPSKVQTYRCNYCDYKTNCREDFKTHQLKHKEPSEVEMYSCNYCSYETKHKRNINQHGLIHKDPSEVQMYRCNNCDYKTKYKGDITRHQLKHKGPSEVQTYRCNYCDYKTKYKGGIKRHQLKCKESKGSNVQV